MNNGTCCNMLLDIFASNVCASIIRYRCGRSWIVQLQLHRGHVGPCAFSRNDGCLGFIDSLTVREVHKTPPSTIWSRVQKVHLCCFFATATPLSGSQNQGPCTLKPNSRSEGHESPALLPAPLIEESTVQSSGALICSTSHTTGAMVLGYGRVEALAVRTEIMARTRPGTLIPTRAEKKDNTGIEVERVQCLGGQATCCDVVL